VTQIVDAECLCGDFLTDDVLREEVGDAVVGVGEPMAGVGIDAASSAWGITVDANRCGNATWCDNVLQRGDNWDSGRSVALRISNMAYRFHTQESAMIPTKNEVARRARTRR
jgi:hypothetical protein